MDSSEKKIVGGYEILSNRPVKYGTVEVYDGRTPASEERVVIKLEPISKLTSKLPQEAKIQRALTGKPGIPNVLYSGATETQNVLVIEAIGESLESLFIKQNRRFSLKTVLMLGDQMLSLLEYVHGRGFVHRNICMHNFAMGPDSKQVYLVDFGQAKRYLDPATKMHYPYRDRRPVEAQSFTYMSVNAHNGIEQSRRDDIEGLCYVLIHMLRGDLPWLNHVQHSSSSSPEEHRRKVRDIKANISPQELCEGLPGEITQMVSYARAMYYDHRPDFKFLHRLLRTLFLKMNFTPDFCFDWTIPTIAVEARLVTLGPRLIVEEHTTPEISPAQSEAPSVNGDETPISEEVFPIIKIEPLPSDKKPRNFVCFRGLCSCLAA